MNYEQRYKEALKAVKELQEANLSDDGIKNWVEEKFPELKESGDYDERIRKALIDGFKRYDYGALFNGCFVREILAWLEKQGEQKSIDYNEELKKCRKNPLYFFDKYVKLEERKSADKVESKFHEGDWVANDYCVGKVIALTDDAYLLDSGQGIPFSCEHNAHLWTIKDAKSGDVLCCESGWTCIFKTLNSDNISFSSYCFMDNTGWFCETGSESHTLEKAFIKAYNGNIYPATKEQRDLLFQKMKEAGYTWNAEKKELLEIEEELTDFEKSLKHIMIETLECGDTRNLKADAEMLLRIAQKSTNWSEEDETNLYHLKTLLENLAKDNKYEFRIISDNDRDKYTAWLKSIKQRHTWKPSEEQMRALHDMNLTGNISYTGQGQTLIKLYNDLKKL